MNSVCVSVVMPVYNATATLGAAIMSVVLQLHEHWELIVVDDGSVDSPENVVKNFNDRRIQYIQIPHNGGLAAALNRGISEAKSRFIARMDADDYMEEWRLRDQVRYMIKQNLAVLGTGADKFGVESGAIRSPETGQDIINSFLVSNPFVHPTVMLDRAQIGTELRYNPSFRCEEDYELWSRVVTAKNCHNIGYSTLRYRTASNGNANQPQKKALNRIVLQQFCNRFGLATVAPIAELNEFQINGFVNEPGFLKMKAYAELAEKAGLPQLGWIQRLLKASRNYSGFMARLNDIRRFVPFRF